MKKLIGIIFFLLMFMLVFTGCQPEPDGGIVRETAAESTLGRPVAPSQMNRNAFSILTYFPGSYVRDFTVNSGLYIYFAQSGLLSKYSLLGSCPLEATANVDVNYIDYIGYSWGLAGASNTNRQFYINLMESPYYYINYPADLTAVYGFSVYYADNYYHFVVSAAIANRTTRYLIDYLYQDGILYRRAVAAIPVDDYLDISTAGCVVYGANATGYPVIWKKDSVAAAQYYEILAAGYNCHGFESSYTGKSEILYFARSDFSYHGNTNAWGFYNLNYFTNTNTVEVTFLPLSGITF